MKKIITILLAVFFISCLNVQAAETKAKRVRIIDAGDYYTGAEVETALQEIGTGTTLDTLYVRQDGTTPLTGNWEAGAYTITANGLTLGQDENITLGSQTFDHDGTDFVLDDSLAIGGTGLSEFQEGCVFNDAGGSTDATDTFRVEGGTEEYLFYIKPSNNTIGSGTSAPWERLTVIGDQVISDDSARLTLRDSDDDTAYSWHTDTAFGNGGYFALLRGTDDGTGVTGNYPVAWWNSNDDLFLKETLSTSEIYNTGGDLKIQPDVQGDVVLFGDTDVGDEEGGKKLIINRKAAEEDAYGTLFLDEYNNLNIDMNWSGSGIYLTGADGISIIYTSFFIGADWEGEGINSEFFHYGYITAAETGKAVGFQLDDTDDIYHLTREDANILGFSVDMPLFNPDMKTGTDQANAGAAAGELYCDTDDGFVVRLGQQEEK